MSRFRIEPVVFVVGLAAVCWIGAGYAVTNPLASAVTLLIGACYVAGAWELYRFQQATATLARAVAQLNTPPARLAGWLDTLHPGLRNAVRARIEGERVGLPGPALAPYLTGLLVLLGMLGTLLGMVVTLKGTGAALESATDLDAIRASLAAPVNGLGLAFGTSIAGVATSAMLGLLSALCRRARIEAAQQLDVKIATTLRAFSPAHQREASFKLLQRQADAMPALVDKLGALMTLIERQGAAQHEQQIATQQAFAANAEAAWSRLAASVGQSLKASAAESARAAGAALQPVVEATMAGLARESASMQGALTQAVQQQLEGLVNGFEASTANVAEIWNRALAQHRQTGEALAADLGGALERFNASFEQRAAGLLDGVSTRFESVSGTMSQAWQAALEQQARAGEKLAAGNQQALATAAAAFEQHSAALLRAVDESHADLQTKLGARDEARLASWAEALAAMAATLRTEWEATSAVSAQRQQEICAALAQTANDIAAQAQQHASKTIAEIDRLVDAASQAPKAAANLHAEIASRDAHRLEAWTASLAAMSAALREQWEATSVATAQRQQEICATLAQTANDITTQSQAHNASTIAEIGRLVQAASVAPQAAAEVIAELRQKLSDSMVRDTAMLDERNRLLATLETLLDAVNRASTEQRSAIDALVSTSSDLLERVGGQFSASVEAGSGKLGAIAAQVSGSAVEVASLGDAFGAAVSVFGESNDKLVAHLERIEAALDKSLARSDDQLAYYVAQAREVIDLSMLSQKQIVENLQQLASQRASAGAEAA
ncbi:DUF802 domain-containing protein [Paraburkholderia silvatlantica]|uniref:DUF802 domain-containing protein n=1 Tax=Paraburkholderia silvatlantica TaxID=321895 RepID=A0ABR6FP41_9BURK|nr:DUF802 domain-containing protein [Paraburkholderia silvatlantica]MBB2929197.1 hypothetical protein [Paraburkholderia silvatlantica]PVY27228.1 uncharacterized protein DUF802 [Paraburkholderia silvatlantica]PXW34257.1 uncharacterized protein DUF802 [Paraburkholderia silvatlantica]TDQ85152.1 uncharacterized protein DUF802 [Paraburkholderia silvatlantica]